MAMVSVQSTQSTKHRLRHELPHLADAEVDELARIVERLVAAFQPTRIYVFGSQARGTPGPNSDTDLLVLVEHANEPMYRLSQAAYGVVGDHRVPLDILFMTRADFETRAAAVASLPATVLREGKAVYASSSAA